MIDIVVENLVTDLRSSGVSFDEKALTKILDYLDIDGSTATPFRPESLSDIRNKTLLVSDGSSVIGFYKEGRFIYNPKKLKPTNLLSDYSIFLVTDSGKDIQKLRLSRKDDKAGLIPATSSDLPKSMNYVWEKDWDPEFNRNYYIKLLQQNKLGMYSVIVDGAYKTCMELIQHHYKEQTVGKRANVYNEKINKLVSQIRKVEDLIKKIDANFDYTVDDAVKMKKEIKRLETIEKECDYLIKTEDDTIRRFGYAPKRPHVKITK